MSGDAGNFPSSLQTQIDSSTFQPTYEDSTLRTPLEGGYLASRPRHTRPARRSFQFGYTEVDNTTKMLLEVFYRQTTLGGALSFDFTDPTNGAVITVMFMAPPEAQYKGIKTVFKWDITCKIQEV